MEIKLIVAKAKNNAIGKDNDLIWHLPADLKFFKKTTSGNTLIMGRKTFESIGFPLPNRETIIVTRNSDYSQENCKIASSIENAIEIADKSKEIFIAGGANIYEQALDKDLIDTMIITEVDADFEADVYFPEFDQDKWNIELIEPHSSDEKNKFNYSFKVLSRKK
jgi:dihydrofolate reductase